MIVNVKKSNGTAKSDYVDLLKYVQLDANEYRAKEAQQQKKSQRRERDTR